MRAIRITTVVEKDGELHLSQLPCRKGDSVEAIVLLPDATRLSEQEEARRRFLARAQASKLRSSGPYPSREELHERT